MVTPVPRWRDQDRGDGERIPAVDLYNSAVEEYRFQVTFNWSRTQYLLVFNAGILAAATLFLSRPMNNAAAIIYALGAVTGVMSMIAIRTQHTYYRAARDRVRRAEEMFQVPKTVRMDTTAAMAGRADPIKVSQVIDGLFVALVVTHVLGVALVFVM